MWTQIVNDSMFLRYLFTIGFNLDVYEGPSLGIISNNQEMINFVDFIDKLRRLKSSTV
jgi:hypothetical protein